MFITTQLLVTGIHMNGMDTCRARNGPEDSTLNPVRPSGEGRGEGEGAGTQNQYLHGYDISSTTPILTGAVGYSRYNGAVRRREWLGLSVGGH